MTCESVIYVPSKRFSLHRLYLTSTVKQKRFLAGSFFIHDDIITMLNRYPVDDFIPFFDRRDNGVHVRF